MRVRMVLCRIHAMERLSKEDFGMKRTKKLSTKTLTLAGLLTAIVVVLQLLGSFIHLGPFSISLVLIPIVIGAATCGTFVGSWLGLAFGIAVFLSGDAALFFSIHQWGTVLTVLLKGLACGFFAALAYRLLQKYNRYVAVVFAAIVCPVVNTGIFLIGCRLFFWGTVAEWAASVNATSVTAYAFLGLVGANFLVELGINIVLAPVIIRLLNIRQKQFI
jgi:uncharacterized membrane protein